MDKRDQILQIIKNNGPILPIKIAKELRITTLISSAMLSELVSKGKLKVSNIKVGGSPLYYLPEQSFKLQDYVNNLHQKDQRTYQILREKKIIRDKEQEPLIRVSLRTIKDFAVPLEVNLKNGKEIFWKWYLLSNEEAEKTIKKIIEKEDERNEIKNEVEGDVKIEKEVAKEEVMEKSASPKIIQKIKKIMKPLTHTESEKHEIKEKGETQENIKQKAQEEIDDEIKSEKQRLDKSEMQVKKTEEYQTKSEKIEKAESKSQSSQPEILKSKRGDGFKSESKFKEKQKKKLLQKSIEEQRHLEDIEIFSPEPEEIKDKFLDIIRPILEEKEIIIKNINIIKENSEIDFILNIPTPVGIMTFYSKAIKKKRYNDKDLASAFVQGELKKLPTLFIFSGQFTKKAQKLLETDFKNIKTLSIN